MNSKIFKLGDRRFIVPSANEEIVQEKNDFQVVDYDIPYDDKRMHKHLIDKLTACNISHKVREEDGKLYVSQVDPELVSHFCKFHEKRMASVNYTHFISIPLCNDKSVIEQFDILKKDIGYILLNTKDGNLHPSHLLTEDYKLHLTVCMLELHSNEDRARAIDVLRNHQSPTTGSITLDKLSVFKGTVNEARVVVANTKVSDDLNLNLQQLREAFVRAELSDSINPTSWHMTLLNSKYLERHYKFLGNKKVSFNAKNLIKQSLAFHDKITINEPFEVHLSSLNKAADSKTGYYHAEYVSRRLGWVVIQSMNGAFPLYFNPD